MRSNQNQARSSVVIKAQGGVTRIVVLALLALIALAGCGNTLDTGAAEKSVAASAEAASATDAAGAPPVAVAEHLAIPDAAPVTSALRTEFTSCVDAAGGVDAAMQDCIGEEYSHQDTRLNAAYGALRKSLPADRMALLRTEQRSWIDGRDRGCTWDAKTEGSAQRLNANYCRMEATAKRADALEAILRGDVSSAMIAPTTSNAALDAEGRLRVTVGDMRFDVRANDCDEVSSGLSVCAKGVELAVDDSGDTQMLRPAGLHLNARSTVYRGQLDNSVRGASPSIVVSDIDGDGDEDLAVRTGTRGAYGAASYETYLYDAARRDFVLSREFSELTVGKNGLFSIEAGKLHTSSKSGCCVHSRQTYAVKNGKPELIEETIEDATANRASPSVVVRRLIDGKMQVVD